MKLSSKITFAAWIALLLSCISNLAAAQEAGQLFREAQLARERGDSQLAISLFERMERVAAPEDRWQARVCIGHIYQSQKKYRQALDKYESVDRSTLPSHLKVLLPFTIADCYASMGDGKGARMACEAIEEDSLSDSLVRFRLEILARASLRLSEWDRAKAEFQQFTQNQFARAMIADAVDDYRYARPRHIRGAIAFSQLIPGVVHIYTREAGKAVGNFALIGGVVAGSFIFWPASVQLALLIGIDWMVAGAPDVRKKLEAAREGRREEILRRILLLTQAEG